MWAESKVAILSGKGCNYEKENWDIGKDTLVSYKIAIMINKISVSVAVLKIDIYKIQKGAITKYSCNYDNQTEDLKNRMLKA